jgi:hypothetical protein
VDQANPTADQTSGLLLLYPVVVDLREPSLAWKFAIDAHFL